MIKKFWAELNAFYPAYLRAHSDVGNQALHFIGSVCFYGFLILAFALPNYWLIIIAIFAGYLFPGIGHRFFQHNKSFRSAKPVLCVLCAARLFFDTITFQVHKKMRKAILTG
ncbi:MAG: DUF962 domain-containing protein [Bacteroidetes bacterium]|nr:DUF962 domain-containing protein [Bacteroidota bacterium]MBS1929995.1 DUF962 domain-containing protein [Bacteroidota bacterium]